MSPLPNWPRLSSRRPKPLSWQRCGRTGMAPGTFAMSRNSFWGSDSAKHVAGTQNVAASVRPKG